MTKQEIDKNVELIKEISGCDPYKCMKCGKCSATCPAYDEMEYHPHQFVYMVERGQIDRLMASKSIYRCLTCFACLERCPRNVEPAKLIFDSSKGFGADMLITACPLCMYNLNKSEADTKVPVYYFTELLAEALGVKEGN